MLIRIVSAPCVSAYLNLDHHFVELGEVAAHLRDRAGHEVRVVDGVLPEVTWDTVVEEALHATGLVVLHVTLDNTLETARTIRLLRQLSPGTRIALYGRGAYHLRRLFQRTDADWIVLEQDWEPALAEIAAQVAAGVEPGPVPGTLTRTAGTWTRGPAGVRLAGDWELPALDLLPVAGYARLPADESYPGREPERELAVGVSRGCDSYCGYCPIPDVMGRHEYFRTGLDTLAGYLRAARESHGYTAVSLFGANFTAHRDYVHDFCARVGTPRTGVTWKCVTSHAELDPPLLGEMAAAGCTRVAVGVESLLPDGRNRFSGRVGAERLADLGAWCAAEGILLICFVMVGLPGQTRHEVAVTLDTVRAAGAVPRPMTYVDYRRLAAAEDFTDVFWANRKTVSEPFGRGILSMRDTALAVHSWEHWLDTVGPAAGRTSGERPAAPPRRPAQ
ncbi:B12-binding domain-containing radical SAM protein [Streptomyces sp. NPDC091412]|uniref:B12-binding domain-containing radical SAM protein n=1 Tax=Streptomyces sp. NPDC091412 TaxID=3366002 RepID=UPI00382BAA25